MGHVKLNKLLKAGETCQEDLCGIVGSVSSVPTILLKISEIHWKENLLWIDFEYGIMCSHMAWYKQATNNHSMLLRSMFNFPAKLKAEKVFFS